MSEPEAPAQPIPWTRADYEKLLQEAPVGTDIHKLAASKIFGVELDDVTPEQRRFAKMQNFAASYS